MWVSVNFGATLARIVSHIEVSMPLRVPQHQRWKAAPCDTRSCIRLCIRQAKVSKLVLIFPGMSTQTQFFDSEVKAGECARMRGRMLPRASITKTTRLTCP